MNYNQYLFSCLLKEFNSEFNNLPYDLQFDQAIKLYESFEKSDYNNPDKGLYECITDYLSSLN